MTSLHRLLTSATVLATVTTMAACRHKAPPQPGPTQTAAPTPTRTPEPTATAEPATSTSEPSPSAAETAAARARALLATPVYFAFDRDDVDAEARANLDAKVEVLRADRALRVRVEGHTDDRGSDEYNLALGQRRATAVRRYLAQRDIGSDRIDVVTLGEERPTCSDASETCRRANRRAEFVVIAP